MHEAELECGPLTLSAMTSLPFDEFQADKEVVLFLHGWLDNLESMLPLASLCQSEQRIVLDLPGHGKSDHRPPGSYYYFSEWAMDIAGLIHHYGWSKVSIVGHSMGGFIAQLAALTDPEHIQRIFLIEAYGLLTYDETETSEKLKAAFASRTELLSKKAPVYKNWQRVTRARAERGEIDEPLIRPVVLRNLRETSLGWEWRIDPRVRLGSPFRYSLNQVDDLMRNLSCKVNLIRGSCGFDSLEQAIERWGKEINVNVVKGGHHVHLENPEQVNTHLNAFLMQKG